MSFNSLFEFERQLAEYTGAPYAVLTDGCTHALELCFRYDRIKHTRFTAHTYLSVPMLMYHLGIKFELSNEKWLGEYQFKDTRIWDSARRLEPNMYRTGQFQCLSFGWGKPIQVGKMGAILLDDKVAYEKFSRQRSDGRDLHITPWQDDQKIIKGYHYCPTLESCDKALILLKDYVPSEQPQGSMLYPDLRNITTTEMT